MPGLPPIEPALRYCGRRFGPPAWMEKPSGGVRKRSHAFLHFLAFLAATFLTFAFLRFTVIFFVVFFLAAFFTFFFTFFLAVFSAASPVFFFFFGRMGSLSECFAAAAVQL